MVKILIALMLGSVALFASSGAAEGGTDIIPRTINFLIFAGILWYLLAEPVKGYFVGRTQGIADELDKIQVKLRESKEAKEAAMQKVEEAKKFSEEIKVTAEKENKILIEKIALQCDTDIETLEKQNISLMELERRKAVREVVGEVLDDVLAQAGAILDKEKMAQIIMKKVA
jgi:F-type H+-transporting ATPase subunit b